MSVKVRKCRQGRVHLSQAPSNNNSDQAAVEPGIQTPAHFRRNYTPPARSNCSLELFHCFWMLLTHKSLQQSPHIFYRVEIWAVCGPDGCSDWGTGQICPGCRGHMGASIILLINYFILICQGEIVEEWEKLLFQNVHVGCRIDCASNNTQARFPGLGNASPNCKRFSILDRVI